METIIPPPVYSPEFEFVVQCIQHRLSHLNETNHLASLPKPPPFQKWNLPGRLPVLKRMSSDEISLLLIALAPHVFPDLYDRAIENGLNKPGDFPQLGGVRGKNYRGFIPTGETALFLLAGSNSDRRLEISKLFDEDHIFARQQILWLEEPPLGEPLMSGKIIVAREYIELLTRGKVFPPRFGMNFPAQKVETALTWNDLVLPSQTLDSIKELEIWIKHGNTLLDKWDMNGKIKPGYRVLFHGTPGTGKTLTASLLGKYTGKEVYKIDLSMVVSKFIGETEKNLANLFDKAENKNWILFFDEADALFGKRTSVRDAHDKYANQEVSFLLQRTEGYAGLVILATNFKSNIDDAFTRRFQSHIFFPSPKYNERIRLWQKAFPKKVNFDNNVDLSGFARQFELTGAQIMNVVQYACLQTLHNKSVTITKDDLLQGINKEFNKEGKTI